MVGRVAIEIVLETEKFSQCRWVELTFVEHHRDAIGHRRLSQQRHVASSRRASASKPRRDRSPSRPPAGCASRYTQPTTKRYTTNHAGPSPAKERQEQQHQPEDHGVAAFEDHRAHRHRVKLDRRTVRSIIDQERHKARRRCSDDQPDSDRHEEVAPGHLVPKARPPSLEIRACAFEVRTLLPTSTRQQKITRRQLRIDRDRGFENRPIGIRVGKGPRDQGRRIRRHPADIDLLGLG